ncbi:hypothetical protein FB446DRAFT_331008 [Lentinula raphanica]|nr:hypothetical protein FB446DRAFT_331008 [Lentinula raphanica]
MIRIQRLTIAAWNWSNRVFLKSTPAYAGLRPSRAALIRALSRFSPLSKRSVCFSRKRIKDIWIHQIETIKVKHLHLLFRDKPSKSTRHSIHLRLRNMYYTYLARRKTFFAWLTIQGGLATFVASQYLKPKSQLSALGSAYRLQQQNAAHATH